jgi:hypothetical protein
MTPLLAALQYISSLDRVRCPTAHITLDDEGSSTEIAAMISYENTIQSNVQPRTAIVICRDGENHQLSTISRLWEPLAYPLLFPHGTLGWGMFGNRRDIAGHIREEDDHNVDADTCGRQIMYYRA